MKVFKNELVPVLLALGVKSAAGWNVKKLQEKVSEAFGLIKDSQIAKIKDKIVKALAAKLKKAADAEKEIEVVEDKKAAGKAKTEEKAAKGQKGKKAAAQDDEDDEDDEEEEEESDDEEDDDSGDGDADEDSEDEDDDTEDDEEEEEDADDESEDDDEGDESEDEDEEEEGDDDSDSEDDEEDEESEEEEDEDSDDDETEDEDDESEDEEEDEEEELEIAKGMKIQFTDKKTKKPVVGKIVKIDEEAETVKVTVKGEEKPRVVAFDKLSAVPNKKEKDVSATKTKKKDEKPAKKGKKEKGEETARDRFGFREGTRSSRVNAAIGAKSQTTKELETKAKAVSISSHLNNLVKAGHIKKDEDGYYDPKMRKAGGKAAAPAKKAKKK